MLKIKLSSNQEKKQILRKWSPLINASGPSQKHTSKSNPVISVPSISLYCFWYWWGSLGNLILASQNQKKQRKTQRWQPIEKWLIKSPPKIPGQENKATAGCLDKVGKSIKFNPFSPLLPAGDLSRTGGGSPIRKWTCQKQGGLTAIAMTTTGNKLHEWANN